MTIFLLGNSSEIGNWDTNRALRLNTDQYKFPIWESNIISFNSNNNPSRLFFITVLQMRKLKF